MEAQITAAEKNLPNVQGYLSSRGISEATARRFRLGHDPHTGRLTIPYLTATGAWHLKYRCTADHDCKTAGHGKYVYDPGVENHLFNARTLLDHDIVVVVEGELDAIACEQHNIPAVAYPGASTWSKAPHWRWCFDSVDEVVVVADADEPGRKAAATVAQSLRSAVQADVRVVHIPGDNHEDANSFLHAHGEQEFLHLLEWT